jgi:hypothetical protein
MSQTPLLRWFSCLPIRTTAALSLAILFTLLCLGKPTHAGEWFVATDGDDAWSGTLPKPNAGHTDGPLATLNAARDKVRQHTTKEPVIISMRQGVYALSSAFELTAADSGTAQAPVVFRSYPEETATISGGRELAAFHKLTDANILECLPASARGEVWVTDLSREGVVDFGTPTSAGTRAELFFDGEPMTLARWPNDGFVKVQKVVGGNPITVHGITGDSIGKFVYEGDRPERWKAETDLWVHGYWFWDWSDAFQPVQAIDTGARTLELKPPHHNYGYRNGQRYYALNALSELDRPGEWYLDRTAGRLYLWPPASPTDHRIVFSVLPTLLRLKNASWITFEGLTFEASRGTAVTIENGTGNRISNCLLHDIAGWAVSISNGTNNGVSGCEITQVGEGGVSLSGGDRMQLVPSGHYAENNHIHGFGRIFRTYRPAVGIDGVGQRVVHNLIHDGPHNAIQLGGNDHLIEFNEIHHVCYETGDVGAFYMGRDWTARGTVIRHNHFHDIQGPGLHGAMGVYLDDSASGITVFGNVFHRAGRAAFIGGGRDNLVENNIFVDCTPSVHVDARGLGWMRDHVEAGGVLPQRLAAMPTSKPPWSERYPRLLGLLDDEPGAPKGNRIVRNISVGGTWKNIEKIGEPLVVFEDNWVDQEPGFIDAARFNFQLRDDAPALRTGFKRIPIEQIGLLPRSERSAPPTRP